MTRIKVIACSSQRINLRLKNKIPGNTRWPKISLFNHILYTIHTAVRAFRWASNVPIWVATAAGTTSCLPVFTLSDCVKVDLNIKIVLFPSPRTVG